MAICRRQPLVYLELRKLAAAKLVHEKLVQTLHATALVHEAYIRLVDQDQLKRWGSRGHFFSAAAEAMRWTFYTNQVAQFTSEASRRSWFDTAGQTARTAAGGPKTTSSSSAHGGVQGLRVGLGQEVVPKRFQ